VASGARSGRVKKVDPSPSANVQPHGYSSMREKFTAFLLFSDVAKQSFEKACTAYFTNPFVSDQFSTETRRKFELCMKKPRG